jgi:hypothetical protein
MSKEKNVQYGFALVKFVNGGFILFYFFFNIINVCIIIVNIDIY